MEETIVIPNHENLAKGLFEKTYSYFPFELERMPKYHVLASALFFFVLYWTIGYLSLRLQIYRDLPYMKKVAWRSHIVSQVHALVICYGAIQIIQEPAHYNDPVFGFSTAAEKWFAYSTGYFVWDCWIALRNFEGFAFVYHGFNCLLLCFAVYRPVYQFYGMLFLLFETSTIFLNVHWFCDKVGLTGSKLQMINGVFLLATFLFVRLLFGTYHIYGLFYYSFQEWERLPPGYCWFFFFSTIVMQSLNVSWFFSMVKAIQKRMPSSTKKSEVDPNLKLKSAKLNKTD